ncbi:MAG TPA: XRE family transcriptional regulator [Anaerolineae bacterium]|nr:XRE family transcriptional regulator [Anaerolineae bacterium]HMR63772.1 XRE family transcriptional regulator [Anaerolineae bacterium]
MNTELVNVIFGMKVRQARIAANLSLSEFANRCDLSPSYITEIEKGRKHPKADKIMKMAEVLNKSYDELVSIKLSSSLTYLETMLSSPLLQQFPFEEFGLELSDLINLFTRMPNKASAFANALLEIAHQYNMKDEHLLRAALRSYQEMHENYFQEIEDTAAKFAKENKIETKLPIKQNKLEKLICQKFGYELETQQLAGNPQLSAYRSVYVSGRTPKLLLNASLKPAQIKFLLARELGYRVLKLSERSYTSMPNRVDSFQQVLNDFRASYFAGALLMPRAAILEDLHTFFQFETWRASYLLNLLEKYEATPEMLLYRLSELMAHFFGIKLHFLRFNGAANHFKLIKQFNINRLLLRDGISYGEHYCQRWLANRLLRELSEANNFDDYAQRPLVGGQIEEFLNTHERIFTFGFARPLALTPRVGSSATLGFRLTPDLNNIIRFIEDPAIPVVTIDETCERCPLTSEQCKVRIAEPVILTAQQELREREAALSQLIAQMRE